MSDFGFTQFWIYMVLKKIHFKTTGKSYNIMTDKLPAHKRFLTQWNGRRVNTDGVMFLRLSEKMPQNEKAIFRLYAYYYLENPDFHISAIFNDDFRLWYKYEYEIRNLETVVSSDWLKLNRFCQKKGIQIKTLFFKEGQYLPILKLYDARMISVHSLLAFNQAFGFYEQVKKDNLHIIYLDKMKKYDMLFVKYFPIVKTFYDSRDWKTFLRDIT